MNFLTFDSGARLTPFLAEKPNGIGVLVLPGGGYWALATGHEGTEIAAWLSSRGFDAWMLEYRIAHTSYPAPLHPAPLEDALHALMAIRAQNRVSKLGVWGFSAGGHLAGHVATTPEAKLDFAVLAYPVVTLEKSFAHAGSRQGLLGENPDPKWVHSLSIENRIGAQTPPMFLFHTGDDAGVPPENSLVLAAKLRENGVPFELHIHENGRHGVGLASEIPDLRGWSEPLEIWLRKRKKAV